MLTKAQYNRDRKTESDAARFVKQVFRNAKKSFHPKACELMIGGYTTRSGKNINLAGYKELSEFIHSLSPRMLKAFFLFFIVHVHMGAYHISKRDLKDFEEFSNMEHVVEIRKIERRQKK